MAGVGSGQLSEIAVSVSAGGDNTLIAAVASKTLRVYKIFLVFTGDTTVTPKDGANVLTGPIAMKAGGSITLDFDGEPWFTMTQGNAFILNLSPGVQVSGRVYYVQA